MTDSLTLTHVTVGYGSRIVLDDVSFSVRPGNTFLVGENGAGKTTLLKVILGALRPMSGEVAVQGAPVTGAARDRLLQGIGYLPQDFAVPEHLRVAEFLRYMAWLRMIPKRDIDAAARGALDAVALSEQWDSRLGTLSGGMLRRVGVAQAILHRPGVLLLDEPTVGLDPAARVEFRRLVAELGRTTAVVCSTHLLEDAAMVGGTLIALHGRGIAFEGATDELLNRSTGRAPAGMSPLESAFLELVHGGVPR